MPREWAALRHLIHRDASVQWLIARLILCRWLTGLWLRGKDNNYYPISGYNYGSISTVSVTLLTPNLVFFFSIGSGVMCLILLQSAGGEGEWWVFLSRRWRSGSLVLGASGLGNLTCLGGGDQGWKFCRLYWGAGRCLLLARESENSRATGGGLKFDQILNTISSTFEYI